ncbi:MAG: hypothetical protein HZB33_00265 [Nitrospirae bacterium]|nr:hypothetical protein [Nitrospirota bacterium]
MSFRNILSSGFRRNLVYVSLLITVLSASAASLFYYYFLNRSIGESYGEKVRMLLSYKDEIIGESLIIFSGFSVLALAAVTVFVVLYTHRIAGPLFRVRAIAKDLSEKKFDTYVKFRQTDAIQPLAEALEHFISVYGKKYSDIGDTAGKMKNDVFKLKEFILKGDAEGALVMRSKLDEKAEDLKKIVAGIKV